MDGDGGGEEAEVMDDERVSVLPDPLVECCLEGGILYLAPILKKMPFYIL